MSSTTVRFRHHAALAVAGLIAMIAAIPLTAAGWFLAPVPLIPLAVAAWAWRAGTDADQHGVRVRALIGQRLIPWNRISEFGTDTRGHAVARLTDGATVPLTAVSPVDLPRLVAASGSVPSGGSATVQP